MKFICRHPYNDRLFSQIVRHLLSFFIAKIENIFRQPIKNSGFYNFLKQNNSLNLGLNTSPKSNPLNP